MLASSLRSYTVRCMALWTTASATLP
jgi:hypothetical protein